MWDFFCGLHLSPEHPGCWIPPESLVSISFIAEQLPELCGIDPHPVSMVLSQLQESMVLVREKGEKGRDRNARGQQHPCASSEQ